MRSLTTLNDDELVDLLIWVEANEEAAIIPGQTPGSWVLSSQEIEWSAETSDISSLIAWCQQKLSPVAVGRARQEQVVIIGGSRGIGLGFVEDYLQKGYSVFTTYRDNGRWDGLKALKKRFPHDLKLCEMDVTDPQAVQSLPGKIKAPISILVLSAGILLCAKGAHPLTDTVEEMQKTMEVNTFAPDRIMRALFSHLLHPHSCAVYISSSLGHFSDNIKGRYHSYRASKAAGNIVMQNWNAELASVWLDKGASVLERPCAFPISPGVVQTDMAGDFKADLTVQESVSAMTTVIDAVRRHKQASFYLYDGRVLQDYPEPLVVTTKRRELVEAPSIAVYAPGSPVFFPETSPAAAPALDEAQAAVSPQ